MRIGYHRRRLADFAGGMRLARELAEREPKERLRQHQQESLEKLVRHAIEHSCSIGSGFRARSGAIYRANAPAGDG